MRSTSMTGTTIMKFLSIFIFFSIFCFSSYVFAKEAENQCIACHKNPDFFTTNKKLYKYFKEWEISIHKQEGVGCSDCHGGDSTSSDKDKAHSNNIRELINPIKYENVLETCGKCHKENLNHFLKSDHYKVLLTHGAKHKAPNCITCHNSINTPVPTSSTIFEICKKCHNIDTEIFPDIPEKAKKLMDKLSYLEHYYRSLISKGIKEGRPHLPIIVDGQFFMISEAWHEFNISKIEKVTGELRDLLQEKRKEMVKNKEN